MSSAEKLFTALIRTFIIQVLMLVLLTLDWLLMKQSNKKHYSPTGILHINLELGQWSHSRKEKLMI